MTNQLNYQISFFLLPSFFSYQNMLPHKLAKIRIDFLQTFQELIRIKNFSKTAERLGVTQGTVSQHLKELENAFEGVKLIKRSSKVFEITQEGDIFYETTKRILNLFENMRNDIIKLGSSSKIVVMVVSSSIPGVYILPKKIMNLQPKFPNVEFNVDVINSREAITKLNRDETKFCAVGSLFDEDVKNLDIKKIGEDEVVIFARKQHPIHKWLDDVKSSISKHDLFTKITEFPWIFREKGSATRDWFLKKWPKEYPINIALDFHDNMAIMNALKKSDAITALSSRMKENITRSREILPIDHKYLPEIKRNFYFVKKKDVALTQIEQEIWEEIPSKEK